MESKKKLYLKPQIISYGSINSIARIAGDTNFSHCPDPNNVNCGGETIDW
jgi:hypothetical protein